jgi:hypothetical protein
MNLQQHDCADDRVGSLNDLKWFGPYQLRHKGSVMHSYKVRPGYGSEKLLIEFGPSSSDERFVADLKNVLSNQGFRSRGADHYVFGEATFFDSPAGLFELDDDGWTVFVHADDHQAVIDYLDQILQRSGLFTKEAVDSSAYSKPSGTSTGGPSAPLGKSGFTEEPPSVR